MRLYNSIQEKSDFFISGGKTIDSFQELLILIDGFKDRNRENEMLYRGQPEARFMLYSSLQRLWLDKKLHNQYEKYSLLINNLIHNCKTWNGGLIQRYLKYFGSSENEMSYLSLMQHYGIPTPLLDFTLDINKSLFFAIEHVEPFTQATEIDKYFSIYYVPKNNVALNISAYFIEKSIEYATSNDFIKNKDLNTTLQFDIVLIDNADQAYRIQNNLNILNQDGAFIFNSSPTKPLERQYLETRELLERIGKKKKTDFKIPKEVGGCLNINKNLSGLIIDYLKGIGIDKNSIYPDINNLKSDCLQKELGNISNK